jgi:hypothetical protein
VGRRREEEAGGGGGAQTGGGGDGEHERLMADKRAVACVFIFYLYLLFPVFISFLT